MYKALKSFWNGHTRTCMLTGMNVASKAQWTLAHAKRRSCMIIRDDEMEIA